MDADRDETPPGTSGSTAASSGATAGSYPTCARCRNHWLQIRVKGHKRFCKYRDCTCDKCCHVAKSQKYAAHQTSVWRAQAQDKALLAQQANQETVTVTRRSPPELDSRLKKRIRNYLDTFTDSTTGGRKRVPTPSAQETDSAGGRTLSTAPATDPRSLDERSDPRYSSHSSTAGTTQPAASPATRIDPRVMEGSGSSLFTGGRPALTAPATDSHSSQGSTAGTTQPAILEWSGYPVFTGGRTLLTAPVSTLPTAPAADSRATERSDNSFSTGNRTWLTTPVTSAAPDTDSRTVEEGCYPFPAGGRTFPTAPVTDFLSVEEAHKALYPSLSSATGRILPIAPVATLPIAPAADSRATERSDNSFSTGNRTFLTAAVTSAAPDTNSRTVDGGCYPFPAGGRTFPTAPVTDFLSVEGAHKALYPSLSSTSGKTLPIAPVATLPTAPIASAAPAVDSRTVDGGCYPFPAGGRTFPTAPVTDFLSVEGAHKALYPSLSSTSGKILPIVPIATPPTAPIASAAPAVGSRLMEGSSYSLPAGGTTLPTVQLGFAAPWMESSPVEGGRYSVPTAFNVKANPSQLPPWRGHEFPNRGPVTSAYNEMLKQYYQNLSYLSKPH